MSSKKIKNVFKLIVIILVFMFFVSFSANYIGSAKEYFYSEDDTDINNSDNSENDDFSEFKIILNEELFIF